MIKRKIGMAKKKRISKMLYHIFMIVAGFFMLYPLLWLLGSSFKPNEEVFTTVRSIIPKTFTIEHYPQGWKGFAGYSFFTFFKNSFVIAILVTIGSSFSAAIVGFGFARLRFPGKGIWFGMMMVTMMLPAQVLMIPRFILFNKLKMTGTIWPLTLPAFFGAAFDVFMVMQFIRSIPKDMDEAARIDGCSWYEIFTRIHIPMIRPAMVMVGVLNFMGAWQDFMGPLLYLNGPRNYTAEYALKMFNDSTSTSNYGATFAMSILTLVPMIILFFAFQKELVEGIATDGIKG